MYKDVTGGGEGMETPGYGPQCPVVVAGRISREDLQAGCCHRTQQWLRKNCVCEAVESR